MFSLKKIALGSLILLGGASAQAARETPFGEEDMSSPHTIPQNLSQLTPFNPAHVETLSAASDSVEWHPEALKGFTNLKHLNAYGEPVVVAEGILLPKVHLAHTPQLETIQLPDRVTALEGSVFRDCPCLTNARLSASLRTVGLGAFIGLSGLTEVDFSRCQQLEKIEALAFRGCQNLVTLRLPASLTALGMQAFEGCSGLKWVDFRACVRLKRISGRTFAGCSHLLAVKLPPWLEEIDVGAFLNCFDLASITLPATMRKIQACAFFNSVRQVIWEGNPAWVSITPEPASPFSADVKHYYREGEEIREFLPGFRKQPSF